MILAIFQSKCGLSSAEQSLQALLLSPRLSSGCQRSSLPPVYNGRLLDVLADQVRAASSLLAQGMSLFNAPKKERKPKLECRLLEGYSQTLTPVDPVSYLSSLNFLSFLFFVPRLASRVAVSYASLLLNTFQNQFRHLSRQLLAWNHLEKSFFLLKQLAIRHTTIASN